jgi:serine/threonine-protein kinase RIO1
MSTKNKSKKNRDILEEKLMKGTRMAIKKLIEERKKKNGYLVVSRNGKVAKIRARSIK